MRKIAVIVVLAATVLAGCELFGGIEGSGYVVSTDFAFTDFTRVSADHGFKLTIVPDAEYSVTVMCDDNIVSYLDVLQREDGIEIGLKNWNSYYNVTLNAEVHMPAMSVLTLSGGSGARVQTGFVSTSDLDVVASGGSTAEISGLTCGRFHVDGSGGSVLTVSALEASSLEGILSGGSDLTAAGVTGAESVNASGGSQAHLLGMAATGATMVLSGGSEAWVDVGGGMITLTASGGSMLYYTGAPTFTIVELSGGSGIESAN